MVVISDLHLGDYGCNAKEIVSYLKSINPQILVLKGDIIDEWQFKESHFPIAHMQVIKKIMNLLSNCIRVVYITGNHDKITQRFFDLQIGDFQLTDKLVMEINGKMT